MNTQKAAKWFAGVLMVIGIISFIPGIVNPESYLFGIISVNTVFNLIYIIAGMAAWFSSETYTAAKRYFKIIGPIFRNYTSTITEYLQKLSDDEARILHNKLEQKYD